jgi:LacI family transcriptional regulator
LPNTPDRGDQVEKPATRRVTIVDVARHAQVSTTAVSKVLRNAYGASPAMRIKVQQAIAELGYRPSAAARGLRGQTYTIGVMIPELRNLFFADILDGITAQLGDSDYQVLLAPGCNGEKAEARVIDAMIDRSMDGLILIAPVSAKSRLNEVARSVPTVVVGRHGSSPAYDSVTDDDIAGAALVVDHLVGLGHRRIAHIEHHETDRVRLAEMPNAQRAHGYREAMISHGLEAEIDIASTSYTQEGGYLGAKQLLARDPRPTAISVAGYDNSALAAFGPISLTSVDQDGRQMGANAARLLVDRIGQRDRRTAQVTLSPTLVVRRTTAAIGEAAP